MEITIEEIQKKFESLPEDLLWAIMAADVDNKIIDICKLQNLKVEQMGQLSLETHMVMFGFTHPDKFEASVQASLKLDPNKTRMLVNAINERILKDIRSKIMALHGQTESEEEKVEEINNYNPADHEAIFRNAGIEVVEPSVNPEMVKPIMPNTVTPAKEPEIKKIIITDLTKTKELEAPEVPVEIEAHKEAPISPKVESYKAPKEEVITPIKESAGSKHDSIIMQKLSGSIQMPKVTTEYATNPASASVTNVAPKVDPYREIPE